MGTREYVAINRRINAFELSEHLLRLKLLQGAKAGDQTALSLLRERYGLRLPLVENALKIRLPLGRSDRN